jgi:hypothetical protein
MNNLQYKLTQSLDFLVAIIITTALIIGVIKFNIFATIDGDIHLNWGYFWNQQILEGQLYPRWFEAAFNGLGTTSFIFYPPLMRFLSLPFGILNLSPSLQLKGTIILILLINSYGVIKLSRIIFKPTSFYYILAIALGILNPFLMSELFKRGGFPSLCFLCLIPWLMISIIHYLNQPSFIKFIYISLICSAIFLSHIPSCLIFVTAYVPSLLILFLISPRNLKIVTIQLALALLLGLLIDAFFVVPILFDTHLVYQAFIPTINVIKHRLFFSGLLKLQPTLIPSGVEDVIAKMFLFNTGLFFLTVLTAYPWKQQNNSGFLWRLQIYLVAFSLLMSTEIALPIYTQVETLRKLQFPWRYLGLSSTLVPYLASYSLDKIAHKFILLQKKIVIVFITIAILLLNYKSASFILRVAGEDSNFINYIMMNSNVKIERPLPPQINLEKLSEQYYHLALPKKGAPIFFLNRERYFFPADVLDYVPKTTSIDNQWLTLKRSQNNKTIRLPPNYPVIEFIQGQGDFTIKQWNKGKRIFNIRVIEEATLNLKTFYYPGWKIELTPDVKTQDRQHTIAPAKDGRIQLKLPKGVYNVKIYYGGTIAEQIGSLISISIILIPLIVFFYSFLKN